MPHRSPRPSAHVRPAVVTSLDGVQRAVRRLIAAEGEADLDDGSVRLETGQVPAVAPQGTGVERPVPEWVDLNQAIFRTFAFVDLCGFTNFTDRFGAHAATELLARFRSATRDVTTRRGTRVAKWLGDGVMLVGTDPGPVVATVAELQLRFIDDEFNIHAGIAAGSVLLFEGDDYIGRSVNLAARLCEAAAPGEILGHDVDNSIPDWVEHVKTVTVRAMGIGDVSGVMQLRVSDDAWADLPNSALHPPATQDVALDAHEAAVITPEGA